MDFDKRIVELLKGDIIIICVFDADVAKRNAMEREKLAIIQKRYKHNRNIIFCDSFPSIEYWFLLHFKEIYPHFTTSKQAERELLNFIKNYEKSETFFRNGRWVRDMSLNIGDIQKAMERAKKSCSGTAAYSKIYLAIDKLNKSSN